MKYYAFIEFNDVFTAGVANFIIDSIRFYGVLGYKRGLLCHSFMCVEKIKSDMKIGFCLIECN